MTLQLNNVNRKENINPKRSHQKQNVIYKRIIFSCHLVESAILILFYLRITVDK